VRVYICVEVCSLFRKNNKLEKGCVKLCCLGGGDDLKLVISVVKCKLKGIFLRGQEFLDFTVFFLQYASGREFRGF